MTAEEAKNILQYLEAATDLFSLASGSQLPITSHWFFRIQRLVLIKSAAIQKLGPLDRKLLGEHPSLREITVVTAIDNLYCDHLVPGTFGPRNPSDVGRLTLGEFLSVWQEVTKSCACTQPMKCLGELEQLRRELVELSQDRTDTRPPVRVNMKVEE